MVYANVKKKILSVVCVTPPEDEQVNFETRKNP
jgi:hypothetical protein